MKSTPCDGAPHGPSSDLGDFAPTGTPDNLNHPARASLDDGGPRQPSSQNGEVVPGSAKGALAEYGGLSEAKRTTSLNINAREIDIPREGYQDAANLKI